MLVSGKNSQDTQEKEVDVDMFTLVRFFEANTIYLKTHCMDFTIEYFVCACGRKNIVNSLFCLTLHYEALKVTYLQLERSRYIYGRKTVGFDSYRVLSYISLDLSFFKFK